MMVMVWLFNRLKAEVGTIGGTSKGKVDFENSQRKKRKKLKTKQNMGIPFNSSKKFPHDRALPDCPTDFCPFLEFCHMVSYLQCSFIYFSLLSGRD